MPRRGTRRLLSLTVIVTAVIATPLIAQRVARADSGATQQSAFRPGDLLLVTTTYQNATNIVAGTTQLPPGCGGTGDPCATAVANGDYPEVFNNDSVDGSFGVTSEITLAELNPGGHVVNTVPVPTGNMVTSFSSKSELALNLSPGGSTVSFVGYDARPDTIDVSNSNTPGVNGPGFNAIIPTYYRVAAQLGTDGVFHFTRTNAFSGDNGRAAITNDAAGAGMVYMAGNGGDNDPAFVKATGAQILTPSTVDESAQTPGAPTPVGSFSVTEVGLNEGGTRAKEDNFRGLTIANNVLYYSKGSGGKGINSVYFVDTSGTACPNGTGLPKAGATLPTGPLGGGSFFVDSKGRLEPFNMCILAGFPQVLNAGNANTQFPFGMFFASPDVLYIADEGNGNGPVNDGDYSAANPTNNPTAGLQKWVFNHTTNTWQLAYTINSGLGLGEPYAVSGLPSGDNAATGEPWAPATDGLRQLTGRLDGKGAVTLYATTSTVSGNMDQGADSNRLVEITDPLGATSQPSGEAFHTLSTASAGTLYRGVSFTPGS